MLTATAAAAATMLLITFIGWVVLLILGVGYTTSTVSDGHTYVATSGSALLFPRLCAPTGESPVGPTNEIGCGTREAMMPLRTTTRAQNRAHRIATKRQRNRQVRLATHAPQTGPAPPDDDEPPPF